MLISGVKEGNTKKLGGHQPQCRYKPQNLNREFKWERILTYQASHEWTCTQRHK